MGRCWSCGSHVSGGLNYVFTCPHCAQVQEIKNLREEASANLSKLAEIQQRGFEELSDRLAEVATVIEWGFAELQWQLQKQTHILVNIDHTLKTPNETQANELRQMAEKLCARGVFDESERRFLRALELNPLDYRIYIGLSQVHLQKNQFGKAKTVLESSLPHAPKRTLNKASEDRMQISRLLKKGLIEAAEDKCLDLIITKGWHGNFTPHEEDLGDGIRVVFLNDENKWGQMVEAQKSSWGGAANGVVSGLTRGIEEGILEKLFEKPDDFEGEYDFGFTTYYVNTNILLRDCGAFDFKSYSYKLIGHIYACEENYDKAKETLKLSLQLSPEYEDAHYDYAQYCALTGDRNACFTSLQKAIEGKSLYYYLAHKEKNFEPLRSEVQKLLKEHNDRAMQTVTTTVAEAEQGFNNLERIFQKVTRSFKKTEEEPDIVLTKTYDISKTLLEDAKVKLSSGDYLQMLRAEAVARKALRRTRLSQKKLEEEERRLSVANSVANTERKKRRWITIGWVIGIIVVVNILSAIISDITGNTTAFGAIFIFSIIIGIFVGGFYFYKNSKEPR